MNTTHPEHWIPVRTSNGMFSSEYAVSFQLLDGQLVSLFVDKDLVRENGGQPLLRVLLIENNPDQNSQLVLLPSETFETASPWVEVANP